MVNQHLSLSLSNYVLAALIAAASFATTTDAEAKKRGWGSKVGRALSTDDKPERRGFFDRKRKPVTRSVSTPSPVVRQVSRSRTSSSTVSRTAQSSVKPERKRLIARVFGGNSSSTAAAARPGTQRALRSVEAPKKPKLAPGQPNSRQSAPKIDHALIARSSKSQSSVTINIPKQRAYLYIGGKVAVDTPISTARSGKHTPRGTFRVGERVAQGKISTIYDVSMPYWMRLGGSVYGMHAGYLPGYPASAGCIRMPYSAAQAVYKATGYGTKVRIY